jgi:hypothetical protein
LAGGSGLPAVRDPVKTRRLIYGFSVVLLAALSTQGQGAFQNLNFENANPVIDPNSPYYPYDITTTSALPNWTVTIGSSQPTDITENDPATGSTWVMLCGPNSQFGFVPLAGNYSVLLQGGGTAATAAISQTGLIPPTAQTLLIDVAAFGGQFNVYIGNQSLALTPVATNPNYTEYGAAVSAWAGLKEQLTISVPEFSGNFEFDDITFSPNAVPEPSIGALTAIGGLLIGARKWLARHS